MSGGQLPHKFQGIPSVWPWHFPGNVVLLSCISLPGSTRWKLTHFTLSLESN